MKSEANKLLVATCKKLLHHHGQPQLLKLIARTHPADLAYVFNRLTREERQEFFPLVSNIEQAAELLTELEAPILKDFLQQLHERQIVTLLEQMSSDDVADVLSQIEDEPRREVILTLMQREELVATQSLMEYDPESAGGLMVPDFLALAEEMTARQALERVQEDAGNAEIVLYLYVVDEHHHLVGVTSLRELVLSPPERLVKDFMTRQVIRISVDTDQEEVAKLIARYNLIALPVVDGNNQLVGIVTVDDIIDVIRSEATEDMMLMAGAGDQQVEELRVGWWTGVRARTPWLSFSALSGALCLLLLFSVRHPLSQQLAWVMILPWMLTMAGTVATQSSAIITRGLVLGRTDFAVTGRVVASEALVGGVVGVIWGVILSLITYLLLALLLHTPLAGADVALFSLRAGLTLCLSLALAATSGAALPMLFSRINLDPAMATAPLITALAHMLTAALWCAALLIG